MAPKAAQLAPAHFIIPDTQVRPGVRADHLGWIGRYLVDQFKGHPNLTVIHLGDHWDMPSLSSYDKGKRAMEGRRYAADVDAGNAAWRLLTAPLDAHNRRQAKAGRPEWWPRRVRLIGNHEHRIERAAEDSAILEGTVDLSNLDTPGWEVIPFLQPIVMDGVAYAHYFYNPNNGRPFSGMIETRLKNVGRSFTQGHQQGLQYGLRQVAGTRHHGLIAGSCYLHDEDYIGPQGNAYWRGIVVAHEVRDGTYDPMMVSLAYLCRRYEGVALDTFMPGIGTGSRAPDVA